MNRLRVKPKLLLLFLIFALVLSAAPAFTQDLHWLYPPDTMRINIDRENPEGTALSYEDSLWQNFQKGIEYYNSERFFDALNIYQNFLRIPAVKNPYLTGTYLMLMKIYLHLGDYDRSIAQGYEFLSRFQTSRYFADVQFTIGDAFLRRGQHENALFYLLNALTTTDDPILQRRARETLETIVDLFLTVAELQDIRDRQKSSIVKIFLTIELAKKYSAQGDYRTAGRELRSVRSLVSGTIFEDAFQRANYLIRTPGRQKIYLGVVLPITGPMAEISNQLLDGIRLALQHYNARSEFEVSAIVLDNKNDMVLSIKQAEFLAKNPKVLAIFGPVSSDNAIAMAAVVNQHEIPLLSPTATNSQLTMLGPWIFQANVDVENLGRFIGKYSMTISGTKTVATLSPAELSGKEMTDAFCESVDQFGGRVLSQQWYSGTPENLQNQFKSIRQAGLRLMQTQLQEKIDKYSRFLYNPPDSVSWARDLYFFKADSTFGLFSNDTLYYLTLRQALIYTGLVDSLEFEIPRQDTIGFKIRSIDALFLPSDAKDLSLILPQLDYYNFSTLLLGTTNLNDPDLISKNPKILSRFCFISDYYANLESPVYQRMVSDFARITGQAPDRFALYGYDSMSALLSALNLGGTLTRDDLRKNLLKMPIFHGVCRNISFQGNKPRSNSCAFILAYQRGRIAPVAFIENGNLIPVE